MRERGTSSDKRDKGELRDVSGEVVSWTAAEGRGIRFELFRRRSPGEIHVRYRQTRDYLWWYRNGINHADLKIDGRPIRTSISSAGDFTFFPAGAWVDGIFEVAENCEYAFVSFEPRLVIDSLGGRLNKALAGSSQSVLSSGIEWLSDEVVAPDKSFELFLEGWGRQALAIVSRISAADLTRSVVSYGGLTAARLRAVEDYLALNLHRRITLAELATVAGCSVRHFLREFQQSTGLTPMRYVQGLRIERAKRLLSQGSKGITEIAVECGFGYVQHFATAFKRTTGLTPAEYRQSTA